MDLYTRDDLKSLMEFRGFPALSFYLPAQRDGTESRQSSTRLKNLARKAEGLLRERGVKPGEIRALLNPVYHWIDNILLLAPKENGLALFLQPDHLRVLQLPFSVEESVTLSDRWRVRPLIPLVTGDGNYHLLALSLAGSRLFDCTRLKMVERPVPGLPASLKEIAAAYEDARTPRHPTPAGRSGGVAKGFSPVKELDKARIEAYLREVDTAVTRQISRDRAPLVIACVDYLFPLYRHLSRYGHLMDRNVSGSPETLKPDRLRAEAWEIVRPLFATARTRAFAQWEAVAGSGRVLEGIVRTLPAAAQGRIESLFLVDGVVAPGFYDPASGAVEPADVLANTDTPEDLYELAAAYVFRHGGDVYLTEPEEMPAGIGVVAILRY